MQSRDLMSLSASGECESVISAVESSHKDENRAGFVDKAGLSDVSRCSSSSSHSTLSVDAATEIQEVQRPFEDEESEHSSTCTSRGKERHRSSNCQKNLLKMKPVTGRVYRAQSHRIVYARPSKITSAVSKRLFVAPSGGPSADEIEDFFADVEEKWQQKSFIERYNFDVVHDVPLPGRYEWVRVQE